MGADTMQIVKTVTIRFYATYDADDRDLEVLAEEADIAWDSLDAVVRYTLSRKLEGINLTCKIVEG